MSEKKNRVVIAKTVVLVLIILLIGLVIWFLTNRNETYTSSNTTSSEYSALECSSSDPQDPFFVTQAVQRYTHSVRILFTDDRLKEMSYRYDGTYNSEGSAENAEAWAHADYNKYMGAYGLNQESLNPVFSLMNNKLVISLYAEAKKVNNVVARLFFINEEEFAKMSEYKTKDYRKLYETKGFTCKVSE